MTVMPNRGNAAIPAPAGSGQTRLPDHAYGLKAVLESVPAIVLIAHDPQCQRITSSRASRELLQMAKAANASAVGAEGGWPGHLRLMKDEVELPPHEHPIQKAASTGKPVHAAELDLVFGDGSTRTIFGNAEPLFDEEGSVRGAIAAFIDVTASKRAKQQLYAITELLRKRAEHAEQQAAEFHALAVELTSAEQEERRRLAENLHDNLQQLLVAAKMRLDMAIEMVRAPAARTAVKDACELVMDVITASRTLTFELSPPVVEAGLGPALNWLAIWNAKKHGLSVALSVAPGAEPASTSVRAVLVHTVRELLFNVVKHAGIKRANVDVSAVGQEVRVTVADEGAGFDPAALANREEQGFGLGSARRRLQLLGGRMDVASAPGRGTRVTVLVPLADPADGPVA